MIATVTVKKKNVYININDRHKYKREFWFSSSRLVTIENSKEDAKYSVRAMRMEEKNKERDP